MDRASVDGGATGAEASGYDLAVDFGTCNTVVVLQWRAGRSQALLFDGAPMLPSAVFLGTDGQALTGRQAQRSARTDPARFEPNPKRCIDDGTVLLGETVLPVEDLIAAVLGRVATEAVRVAGGPPVRTVLTHPVAWGPRRREILVAAAGQAGLGPVALLAEPMAAAAYFTRVLDRPVPVGTAIVVYDLGGGTFDVNVVQRQAGGGWRVLAGDGLDDVGGVDLDNVIVDRVGSVCAGTDPHGWRRLAEPQTPADRRYRRMLLDDAREAKEQLSMSATAPVHVPLLDTETYVTREEFERHARPWLDRTVALTARTLTDAEVPADRIAGVFLVGGASRIPLVATLLHRRLGVAPTAIEQPELVVAQGALHAADLAIPPPPPSYAPPAAAPPLEPVPVPIDPPVEPVPTPVAPAQPRTGLKIAAASAAAVIAVILLVVGLNQLGGPASDPTSAGTGEAPSSSSSACTQPDTFLTYQVGNHELFCTPALKRLAEPWLGSTQCTGGGTGVEHVSCDGRDWTVTFFGCASRKPSCPEARQFAQGDGVKTTSSTTYRAKDSAGTRILGSRDGVPFLIWDSDSAPVWAELRSGSFDGTPFVKEADLLAIWTRYTS